MGDQESVTFRSNAARHIIREAVNEAQKGLPFMIPNFPEGWDGDFGSLPKPYSFGPSSEVLRVCIIGAGVAGLRTAMMLQHLGIEYDLFEASDRHGGRVYTYHFTKTQDCHDYYDLGAMRYPCIKASELTFKLFKELDLEQDRKIIPYIMDTLKNFEFYNDHKVTKAEAATELDPFNDGEGHGGNIPIKYLECVYTKRDGTKVKGVDAVTAKVLEPFKTALVDDFPTGWAKLMECDKFSMRGYLHERMGYSYPVVQWMERESSTGSYDLAFTETVLDSIEFDYPFGPRGGKIPPEEQKWFCVDGGSSIITDRMCNRLNKKPIYNHRVAAIRMQDRASGNPYMFIKFQGQQTFDPQSYSHVISTVPLSCLNSMDLTQAALCYTQKQAIRSLGYGSAIKVGIKFKTRWWQKIPGFEQMGGVSSTDRPVRTVVYPSYGFSDPEDAPGVLMASYNWSQDASRLGAFIQGRDSKAEKTLLDIVYNDLAEMHGGTVEWYRNETLDYFAYDWYHNEYAVGASAYFRAGEFSNLYQDMTTPAAKGHLHFSGEALSVYHAWIEGALASVWRPVYHILLKEQNKHLLRSFLDEWPAPEEIELGLEHWQMLRGIFESTN